MTEISGIKPGKRTAVYVDAELEDIVPGFLERKHQDVVSMREALEREDHDCIRGLGHNLKGTGSGYGFDAISEMGLCIEEASIGRDSDKIRRLIFELSTYLYSVDVVYV